MDDKLYVVGGVDPLTGETLSTVLVFDLTTRTWSTDFPSLCQPRQSCAVFHDGSTLHAVAGTTAELEQLSTCERFNLRTGRWDVAEGLPRGLAASVAANVTPLPVRLMANYREFRNSTWS